ncbi:glucosylceramidase [Fervidobacterium gondwanense DSM 13020]|uniref:Glucosylceramidase n=2 Tax=Fervidobacteriaceae TaxID=1643950 RepID=A0A1M7TIK4_FERGO|nr:glucosylceramidase [Fervidobacterium gondwanense DSM 13020]
MPGIFEILRLGKVKILLLFLLISIVIVLTSNQSAQQTKGVKGMQKIRIWLTTSDQRHLLDEVRIDELGDLAYREEFKIVVNPDKKYQIMDGFGASFTDASAYLVYHKLSDEKRREVMEKLFDREKGIGISFLRQPMGATDYTTKIYSYDDLPEGVKEDRELKHFSIDHDRKYIIPLLKEALKMNPQLKIMASPWSAPGWMKTTGSMIGGSLLRRYYDVYAQYFVKFIKAYESEGIPIYAITVQNEPLYVPKEYPGMKMDWVEQADFIGDYLGPVFEKEGIKTKILTYDHNWDNTTYAAYVLSDEKASKYVAGSAWHFYGGKHEAMTKIKEMFPDKEIWFTEGSGGDWVPAFFNAYMDQMMHVIRIPRNWSKTVVWWNIALDEKRGPTILSNSTCRGLIEINQKTGEVKYNLDYYTLGHISKFVLPGAYRIDSYTYLDKLETVAFENPDGTRVLIISNRTQTNKKVSVIEQEEEIFEIVLPSYGSATVVWR